MQTQFRRLVPALITALVFSLVFACYAPPLPAQQQQQRSSVLDAYAITNARIVPVAGAELARGTIVVRNGLITAVGANAAVPADARVIDGAGLTVYPGLIDANTSLGVPLPQRSSAGVGGAGGNPFAAFAPPQAAPPGASPNSTQVPGLQPEVLAEDIIRPGGEQIDAARNAGVTAALSAPREGIFIGQSAFINLAGDTPQQMIVRSPVALHIGFTPLRSSGYPNSLMGVFSALRQLLLDAQRYQQAEAIYEKNKRGVRRPEQDRSLAALLPVLAREMPVVMYAEREREILRALDLAQEFNLRLIIAGGAESWKVADRIAAAKVPVLLSLNFPRRTSAALPEADPDPLRLLRERADAPKTAGKLAAAGIRFAFQSGGLPNYADYLANAVKATDNGLARDEALRALTIRAAEILGVVDQLGTIEVGKIANLTITRGDLFDKSRRISYVFIDGRPVDLKPVPAAGSGASLASGTWTLRVNLGGTRESSVTLNLQQAGERLTGSIQGDLGSAEIANASVGVSGDIKFTVPVTSNTQTTEATFDGIINGNGMTGTVTSPGTTPGAFTGTRAGGGGATPLTTTPPGSQPRPGATTSPGTTPPTPPATMTTTTTGNSAADISGTWTLNVQADDRAIPVTLRLQQQGARLTGAIQSPFGASDINGGSAGADGFRFSAPATVGGQTLDMTFNGTASGNQMSGTVTSAHGTFPFTGTKPRA